MRTLISIGLVPVVVFVGVAYAWLLGRHWRSIHDTIPPQIDIRQSLVVDRPDVVFVTIDGAFNSVRHHGQRLFSELLKVGDIIELEYNVQRFNRQLSVDTLYTAVNREIHEQGYRRVVILGGSFGAILQLQLAQRIYRDRGSNIEISIIGLDPVLSAASLSSKQRLVLRLTRRFRFGPVGNSLLGWVKLLAFRGLPKYRWEAYADETAIRRHIRAMREFRLSAIIDMLAVLEDSCADKPSYFSFIHHVVQLRSKQDEVVDGGIASREWERVFPESETIFVSDGGHLTYLEHPFSWRDALYEALCLFRLLPAVK